jgi:primosomal protein N' (replication factor Y)
MDEPQPPVILLHGVTGSGKTEVYLQAIFHALGQGRGAIVLVPEIALTPQTVDRFRARFADKPERVAVLHSSLSDGERYDEWHRIRSGEAQIVIGARSALFSPVHNLGLIVVDEEHEPTYKQDEAPRYSARDTAVMRGRMEKCAVVLGSATPALESYSNARNGKYRYADLPIRVDDRRMPMMRIIDMRIAAQQEGKPVLFSRELIEAIRIRLDRAEQTMIFLNRRGFSSSLVCPDCGYVAECEHCSVGMTYHKARARLVCHICGEEKPVPARCPACKSDQFRYTGAGTEKIEEVMRKLFPKARIERMDSDTMRRKNAYRDLLGKFRIGKIDILIGTQMIAKGLDFPNVTLVGVVNPDHALHMADFRAGERVFQLLTQVAGRAGRGEAAGEVIVQTYTPHHPAIQAARRMDFEGFCDQEMAFRKELGYPPYTHLTCITLRGKNDPEVGKAAGEFFQWLEKNANGVALSPAMPAPISRMRGEYRWQILLRSARVKVMNDSIREASRMMKWPKTVKVTVDVDAASLL